MLQQIINSQNIATPSPHHTHSVREGTCEQEVTGSLAVAAGCLMASPPSWAAAQTRGLSEPVSSTSTGRAAWLTAIPLGTTGQRSQGVQPPDASSFPYEG